MNILLIGSGGRENAIAWKLAQSPKCDKLFIAPGNVGSQRFGINLPISGTDFDGLKKTVLEHDIRMLVVGPEDPLVKGVRDFFEQDAALKHVMVIGPGKAGAMLEGSKDFSKRFMIRNSVPTARYATFDASTIHDGYQFLETLQAPYVLKADGLAAGKGVLIIHDLEEAKGELHAMLVDSKFGNASSTVVIEEFLKGIELSVFVLTNGKQYVILPEAKDYKRIGEGDTGPNTGGMGAVSPVPFADTIFMQKVENRIVRPTIDGLNKEDIPYTGFVFIGLMNVDGEPFVIEYNARMGDPETEVVIPRIKNDLVQLFEDTVNLRLDKVQLDVATETALTVIMASKGYPGDIEKGKPIHGLDSCPESIVFHAGTSQKEGAIVTSGGRVLAITSMASSIEEAQKKSMACADTISFEGKYFRRDIGNDLKGVATH
ncbi:MAG: phosphoribosylamine--glycine ligase [Bacteroidota bacterium]